MGYWSLFQQRDDKCSCGKKCHTPSNKPPFPLPSKFLGQRKGFDFTANPQPAQKCARCESHLFSAQTWQGDVQRAKGVRQFGCHSSSQELWSDV